MNFFKKNFALLISLVSGALYASGFPLFNGTSFFAGPILGFALFNWSLETTESLKKQLLFALFYSLGFYLMGFYWIPHLLKEFGGLFFPFNFLLGLLFSLVIIPHVYFYVFIKSKINNILLLSLIFVLLEQLVPQLFPAHLGHAFMSLSPTVKLIFAPVAGALFYSFLASLTALSLLVHFKTKKKPIFYYSIIAIVVLIHVPGSISQAEKSLPHRLKIRLVQPNIGNFLKVDSERGGANSIRSVFDSYFYLSTKNISTPRDLIIWPETAFPNLMFSSTLKGQSQLGLHPLLREIIKTTKGELFIGGYDSESQFNTNSYQTDYNAIFHFDKSGALKNTYHKMKLIPFGEGLPFGPLNPYLSKLITNISYFAEGKEYSGFLTENKIPFVAVICYEVLFPDFLAKLLNKQSEEGRPESQFLINLTNDSWYGETAEPHQHLFLSKWRALEFNLPIIRSTNTGITTVIFPDGTESSRLNVGEKTYLDLDLEFSNREKTIYQKFGIYVMLSIVAVLGLIELAFKRKSLFQ